MRRYLVIYFSIILGVSTYAQQLSKQDEQFADSVMNATYKPGDPGAILLIAKKGEPIFRKGYGLANLELNVSNKPEYVFNIGSMTKQFTAVSMLQLAQKGKLNLQDDIKKYLSGYNTHGRHISIENLLDHTSGIIDYFGKIEILPKIKMDQSKEDLMNFFMNDSLVFEPGTDWGYSNSGYMLAAMIIEKVSGLSLNEYLRQNIFKPLDMSHSYVQNNDSLIVNAVNGYDFIGNKKFQPARYISSSWASFGAGGIMTSVDDLLKWDNALYTEKIIKKEWLEKAWRPHVLVNGQTTNYGLGWTSNNFNGLQILEHAGGINGFSSDGIRIPSEQLYLVMLSNNSQWFVPILSSIALHVTGQTGTRPSNNRMNEKALEEYTGVYAVRQNFYAINRSTVEQTYQYFTTKDDTLFTQSPGSSKSEILNAGKDIFVAGSQLYRFHRNEQGKIISVELYNEPVQTGPHRIQLKTDLPLPKEKQAITLDVKKLELLKGKYDFGGGMNVQIIVEENKVYMPMPNGEKEEIFAENETHFFSKKTDIAVEFIKDNNKVRAIIVTVEGTKLEGKKTE